MRRLSHVLLALSLLDFLPNVCVSANNKCLDLPIFSPSTLIVKYNEQASAECTVCPQACPSSNVGVETPIGKTTTNGTKISWSVQNFDEWEPAIFCYYEMLHGGHCRSKLAVIVYQPPTNVSINFVENSWRMLEGQEYTLRCTVQDVAPFENLTVTFYRGQTPLGSPPPKEKKQTGPGTYTYTQTINITEKDNGAQFWCEAKLVLGPDGPQPSPVVESQKLTSIVHYKPKLHQSEPSRDVTLIAGQVLHLNCSAKGNPRPIYTWKTPEGPVHNKEVLMVDHVTVKHAGTYTCNVTNDLDTVKVEFHVQVHVDPIPIIVTVVIVTLVVCCIIAAIIYRQYYRNTRMGRYQLKDVFNLRRHYVAGLVDG